MGRKISHPTFPRYLKKYLLDRMVAGVGEETWYHESLNVGGHGEHFLTHRTSRDERQGA